MENYKLTKAIRFKLIPKSDNILTPEFSDKFNLIAFVSELNNFLDATEKYLFYQKNGNSYLNDKLTVKNEFLKTYAKQELAEYKERLKRNRNQNNRRQVLTIADYGYLEEKINIVFDEVNEIYSNLVDDAGADLNVRAKHERTGLLLKRLQSKLPFLKSLIENTSDKNETSNLSLLLKKQVDKLSNELLLGIEAFLPQQSSGLPIAKASFNYYTINKKEGDFANKIKESKEELTIDNIDRINLKSYFNKRAGIHEKNFQNNLWNLIKADIETAKENNTLLLGDAPMLNIDNYACLRQMLKNIKAEQKKQFNELMQNEESYSDLKNSNLYLFKGITEQQFNEYADKTEELEEIGTELSNQNLNENRRKQLQGQKQAKSKERGNLLKDKFSDWKNFANFYRQISQKHGKILASLKGIEKEQAEAKLLQFWSLILEKDGKHQLVLIPKTKAQDCKEWLEQNSQSSQGASVVWFESFTYRSLQKLCFGFAENGNNEFNQNIRNLLPRDERGNVQNGEFAFQGDEQRKIKFYKNVLSSQYANSVLKLPKEQLKKEVLDITFDNLDDFKIALEKICYQRFVKVGNDIEQKLKEWDAQIFELNNYDFEKQDQSNLKNHTQIWKEFWTEENKNNNYDIRLNPEITITYRQPKDSRIHKYGKESGRYDKNKSNRYLHPQYTLITTISEHSNSPTKVLAFMAEGEFGKSIDDFNAKTNKDTVKFAVGIDNGEVELSTLGVYLPHFNKTTNEEKVKELNAEKYGFEVLTIKDLNYSEIDYNGNKRKIIQNPSYFLKKENYIKTFNKTEEEYYHLFNTLFERKKTLSLDLTTAKVISGYIVTNGDVPALFNLWLKHAQRNIFAMNDHVKNETDRRVFLKNKLELDKEKQKFAEYISSEEKFSKLTDEEKKKYVQWIFEDRATLNITENEENKFKKAQSKKGNFTSDILFAVCKNGSETQSVTDIFDVRNIFKKREEFYALKSQEEIIQTLNDYNTNRTSHDISTEELDFKLVTQKQVVVGNVVGVVDFLYKEYKERFGGEGIIAKEGFDTQKTELDRDKFSGNIYRLLERKLYQKFQNYGLVPPIKNLLEVRADGIKNNKEAVLRLGNIAFVDPSGTSQECPICVTGKLSHTTICPKNCGFDSKDVFHTNDGIAGYNIAKRGYINFKNEKR